MKLYIKQKVFSWRDRFHIYDADGCEMYNVEGEVFTFGKKLHLRDSDGSELAFIHQKVWSWLPRYFVSIDGIENAAEVVKKFTFAKPKYEVNGPGWTVSGNFWGHEYVISSEVGEIATVSKQWFKWADTYEIDVPKRENMVLALCVVLIIDAVNAQQTAASSAASN